MNYALLALCVFPVYVICTGFLMGQADLLNRLWEDVAPIERFLIFTPVVNTFFGIFVLAAKFGDFLRD